LVQRAIDALKQVRVAAPERRVEERVERLYSIEGQPPALWNLPSGCRFHPRCPAAMPQCCEVEPKEKEVGPEHMVACHLYA
jgi:oligopeptide transport system ATP-binding protein